LLAEVSRGVTEEIPMKRLTNKLNSQRGSALLLTLGVLSLALILSMAFAFSSRTSRQVARVNADQVKARLLAESALERVIAALKFDNASNEYPPVQMMTTTVPDNTPKFIFSEQKNESATPPWQLRYLISKGDKLTGNDLTDFDELMELGELHYSIPSTRFITSNLPELRGYQNITVDGKTIGRIAFLVLEEANKLDINEMLSLNPQVPFVVSGEERLASFTSEENAFEHFFYDIVGNGTWNSLPFIDPAYEKGTVRLGLHMREMRAEDTYYTSLLPGSTEASGTKTMWFSYLHLMNILWKPPTPADPPNRDSLKYNFFSGEDIEAYWDGSDERQRFDITGYEWRDSTGDFYEEDPDHHGKYIFNPVRSGWHHEGTIVAAQDLVEALVGATARAPFYSDPERKTLASSPGVLTDEGDISEDFGIPHLYAIEANTSNLGKQIAANMIDFCDGDSEATYFPSSFNIDSEDEPEYCGNEKVAYFNEVVAKVTVYRDPILASDPPESNYRLELSLFPEMLNIFPDPVPDPVTVPVWRVRIKLFGVAQIKTGDAANSYVNLPDFNSDEPLEFEWDALSDMPIGFSLLDEKTKTLDQNRTLLDTEYVSYKFQVDRIVMISDDGTSNVIYDIGFFNSKSIFVEPVASDVNDPIGYPTCITWEVGDPRLNHKSGSWDARECKAGEDEDYYSAGSDSPTLGKKNYHFNPDSSADREDYAGMDFTAAGKTFSTAFIPNRPFRSFWELGAIHRGEAFKTLDIADVDKELLDQIKIGPLKRTRGKFNANGTNPAALLELFKNIDATIGYKAVNDLETSTITTAPSTLPASPCSLSRGEFASVCSGYFTTYANDREREALIGRTANLLTTRMDKYTILVVGEAIKELEGVADKDDVLNIAVNPVNYNGGVYSILATQRILAHVVRDAWRNEYKIVQMQLLED
jgi:hypothetical protein